MSTSNCPRCGGVVEQKRGRRGRPSIYCSMNCAQVAWLRRRDGVAIDGPPADTCEHTCPACGKLFLSWANRIFCSMECRSTHTRKRSSPHCLRCSKPIPPQADRGAPRKYCSRNCAKIARYRMRRGSAITVLEHGTSEHTCQVCEKLFWGNVQAKFCSRACSDKIFRCRRQMRKLSLFIEDVSITVLIKRDRGVCQLCNGPVNLKAKWPHPDSPSIDHVIPLVRRGEHGYHNTQLAHLGCNLRKGDRAGDTLF